MNTIRAGLAACLAAPFARFVLVGGVNTAATFLLFLALSKALPTPVAYTLSYACGIALSYFLNARFVFQTRLSVKGATRFPLVYVVQYVYGLIVLTTLTSWLHLAKSVSMAVVVVSSIPLTFLLTGSILRSS